MRQQWCQSRGCPAFCYRYEQPALISNFQCQVYLSIVGNLVSHTQVRVHGGAEPTEVQTVKVCMYIQCIRGLALLQMTCCLGCITFMTRFTRDGECCVKMMYIVHYVLHATHTLALSSQRQDLARLSPVTQQVQQETMTNISK